MTPDKHVAERLRFARVLGITPDGGSGLPVGSSLEDAEPRRHRDEDSVAEQNADRRSSVAVFDTPTGTDTETDSSLTQ
ncbi:hypothetical protein OB955_07690 [Halobacteria archaeon AArc-m2/3/4]|uniref:Uncharacterized protein n=1 Tax=Natronoglomus mannanivorans TaxID=2979990 RepID=A0ABT2QCI8_9EURY|nr:hypothetical protein [Halobacteria archaeon AArc-m2/3/4]